MLDDDESWTQVREIPGSRLLVSLHICHNKYANLEIFDLSNKGRAAKVYSLGRVFGGNYKTYPMSLE